MLRQETAEEQAKLQTAANVSQIVPLNMKAFVEDFLKSYGVQDTEKYFAHGPGTPGAAAAPPQGGTPTAPTARRSRQAPRPREPGMTAPPGGGLSMTPESFAQSQLAQVGRTQ